MPWYYQQGAWIPGLYSCLLDLIPTVSLATLLTTLASLCTTSLSDRCAVQLLHSCVCVSISELVALTFTFLSCSAYRSNTWKFAPHT
uniref:Uncharacterized protein n=1 Tax=Ixodes ricinus TaxID=34613 RepID=A0A6B0U1S8_IXORI